MNGSLAHSFGIFGFFFFSYDNPPSLDPVKDLFTVCLPAGKFVSFRSAMVPSGCLKTFSFAVSVEDMIRWEGFFLIVACRVVRVGEEEREGDSAFYLVGRFSILLMRAIVSRK